MRSLVYLVATTLDGFIAGTDRANPDFMPFEGPQVPDLLAEFPEMLPGHVRDLVGIAPGTPNQRFDTVLMGRTTYDVGIPFGVLSPYPHLRQIVVSTSMTERPHPDVEVTADPLARVRELKAEDGEDVWLCGGGRLAAALADEIDELILKVNPVMIGEGAPVFDGPIGVRHTELVGHRVYDNGYAVLRHRWRR